MEEVKFKPNDILVYKDGKSELLGKCDKHENGFLYFTCSFIDENGVLITKNIKEASDANLLSKFRYASQFEKKYYYDIFKNNSQYNPKILRECNVYMSMKDFVDVINNSDLDSLRKYCLDLYTSYHNVQNLDPILYNDISALYSHINSIGVKWGFICNDIKKIS